MVVNNESADGSPVIQESVINQILEQILARIATTLNKSNFKDAEQMLTALENTVSIFGEAVVPFMPQIVSLCEQLLQTETPLSESMLNTAITLFTACVEKCTGIRRKLIDQLTEFMMTNIVPRLTPTDEKIEAWLTCEKDYDYKDTSVADSCADCMMTVSKVLGKQLALTVVHRTVEQAKAGNWRL